MCERVYVINGSMDKGYVLGNTYHQSGFVSVFVILCVCMFVSVCVSLCCVCLCECIHVFVTSDEG